MAKWRSWLKLVGIILCVFSYVPIAWVMYKLGKPKTVSKISFSCYKNLARIIGVTVEIRGEVSEERPLLLVGNHLSYLDIITYGAALPVLFAPKGEIAKWPAVGGIAKMTGCVFIDRRITQTSKNLDHIAEALKMDVPLLLFPEGTTSDSKQILPIRSSYFKLAEMEREAGRDLTIQPVFLAYTKVCNLPLDVITRPKVAWYGAMSLLPHVLELFSLGPIHAVIEFFPPLAPEQLTHRKSIAAECERVLKDAQQRALASERHTEVK